MKTNTKKLTTAAILLALCIVGANVKIMGSIALDSFPAFISALVLGPVAGAGIGFFAHMVSAMLAGFPLTLPIHLIVAVLMAVCLFVYSWTRKKLSAKPVVATIVSILVAYLINVPLDLLFMYPFLKETVYVLFVPLTIASLVNLGIAEVVYLALPDRIKNLDNKDLKK